MSAVEILVVAEHNGQQLNPATARAVRCAGSLSDARVTLAVFNAPDPVLQQAALLTGVARVLAIGEVSAEPALAAKLAPQIAALAAPFALLLGPADTFGKDLMPRVAGLLGLPQVSDIMALETPTRFRRPVYAGNAIATVEASSGPVVGTVRTASFQAAASATAPAPIERQPAPAVELPTHTRFVGLSSPAAGNRPDLQSASRVVSGGRGVGSAENFRIVYALADKLKAAVGASRAAVDAGFVSNELQVGQTGKIIAPELYVAVGISGAIQHLTGIRDARTIVAINKDAEAPIFEVADLGLSGDLFQLLPELEQALDDNAKQRGA
ncbi:MAG TPA: electron transfer flavoprotein subunit alpha/FixB family protein [Steroidobacteraceae bacterium]|nr:electron transfer flavoprotein subunit alpha/FixB family protein [Steroidobacteraceae bacterium]